MGTALEWFGLGTAGSRSDPQQRRLRQGPSRGRAALVGYPPAGYPDVAGSIEALKVMVEAGCDVIELGLPYSDPVMDGPAIQAAAQQALEGGTRTTDVPSGSSRWSPPRACPPW